jgi:hypothetical protein
MRSFRQSVSRDTLSRLRVAVSDRCAQVFTLFCFTIKPSGIRVQVVYECTEQDPTYHQAHLAAQAGAFTLETRSGLRKIPGWLSNEILHGNLSVNRLTIVVIRVGWKTAVDLPRQKPHVVRMLSPGRRGAVREVVLLQSVVMQSKRSAWHQEW